MRRRRFASHRHRSEPTQLRMTSMMDILTVLLLFLLKSFVVEGEVITPASGVELPESHSESTPQESLVIAIDQDRVSIGGEIVADLAHDDDGLLIAGLARHLDQARTQMESLEQRRGRAIESLERITIQGDRDMPYAILRRVMYTCNQSGFGDVQLAVLKTS